MYFHHSEKTQELIEKLNSFMDEFIYPNESTYASQVSDFKQNSLNQVLEAVFKTKEFEGNSYRIEKLHIENERPTIDSIHSKLEFNLILENYADASATQG